MEIRLGQELLGVAEYGVEWRPELMAHLCEEHGPCVFGLDGLVSFHLQRLVLMLERVDLVLHAVAQDAALEFFVQEYLHVHPYACLVDRLQKQGVHSRGYGLLDKL